jgi:hypothetical protein
MGRDPKMKMVGPLCIIVFVAIVAPLLTLIHELGHALVALTLIPQDIVIRLGQDSKIRLFRRGRLQILVQPIGGWFGYYNWAADVVEVKKSHALWIALAGPAASLLTALLCATLKSVLDVGLPFAGDLIHMSMVYAIILFLATIIPIKYPSWWIGYAGRWSDGCLAWYCLFGESDKVVFVKKARHDEASGDYPTQIY